MDESNIVGFTDCYQPQVKAIYQLNQDYLLRMKNLIKKLIFRGKKSLRNIFHPSLTKIKPQCTGTCLEQKVPNSLFSRKFSSVTSLCI